MIQSKLEEITRGRHKARENVHAQVTISFGFFSDWLKKWREMLKPITERRMQNQNNLLVTFDTQLKTALTCADKVTRSFLRAKLKENGFLFEARVTRLVD